MDNNEKIVRAAWEILRMGKYSNVSGWCLALVRVVIERALDITLYGDYVSERVESTHANRSWWARDAERSLRNLGMAVHLKDTQPGDLLFKYDSARNKDGDYVGHVGLLISPGVIFENINPSYRPKAYIRKGALSLSPLEDWPAPTTCIAFDPKRRADG